MRRPAPTPLFTGREAELARLESALRRVSVAWIYGVAGMGKTTLASAFASRWPRPVIFAHAAHASLEALVDDVRRALGSRARPEPRDFETRLADIVEKLDDAGTLLVVDDAHALGDEASQKLVLALAGTLTSGRALFTSRHRLLADSRDPDRLELELLGLDESAARELWGSLDELYGSATDFAGALRRSKGNPLFLRRAHVGPVEDEDLLGSELARLEPDALRLAIVLGLSGRSLPAVALERILREGRLRPALRVLTTALIAEVDQTGAARVHDLFRDALLARAPADEVRAARDDLVRVLPSAGLDPAVTAREIARELALLEKFDELDAHAREVAAELIRFGATGELLRIMDLVPAERRSTALTVERARAVGRHFDMPAAYEELRRIAAETPAPLPHELAYAYAEAAYDMCRPTEALELLEALLEEPHIEPELRIRALVRYAASLTVLGRGEEGRAKIREAEDREKDPSVRARLALQEAMSLNADEEYERATVALRRAKPLISEAALDENAIFVPLTFAVIFARAGRFEEAEELLERLDLDAPTEDESARIFVLASRAAISFERGQWQSSLRPRLEVERLNRSLGGVHYALTGAIWLSRTLFCLGRRKQAYAVLEPALKRATELGCHALAERLERSQRWDPVLALETELVEPSSKKRGEHARYLSLRALSAAADRDSRTALSLLDSAAELVRGEGYALDRALHLLTRAWLDREAPDPKLLAEARRETVSEPIDPELLSEFEDWVQKRRSRPASGPIVDARAHEVRLGPERLVLKTRPVIRRLLYALAARPNHAVSKDDLVQSMWNVAYDPLRHDTPLWQNVARLRKLVAKVGLGIEVEEEGYRLRAPPEFRYERAE